MQIHGNCFKSKFLYNSSLKSVKSKELLQILKNLCIGKQLFKKLEDSLQSKNRREIQKNILKIGKNIFLRTSCASSKPVLDQGFPAISLPASKMAKEVKYDVLSSGGEFGNNEKFCRWCGTLKRREQESVLCGSGDKRSVIEHYFKRGFCCGTIVHFLQEYHEISLNVKTLKRRRLRQFGFDEETIFIRTLYSGNYHG